eukprot:s5962_g2.t1
MLNLLLAKYTYAAFNSVPELSLDSSETAVIARALSNVAVAVACIQGIRSASACLDSPVRQKVQEMHHMHRRDIWSPHIHMRRNQVRDNQ